MRIVTLFIVVSVFNFIIGCQSVDSKTSSRSHTIARDIDPCITQRLGTLSDAADIANSRFLETLVPDSVSFNPVSLSSERSNAEVCLKELSADGRRDLASNGLSVPSSPDRFSFVNALCTGREDHIWFVFGRLTVAFVPIEGRELESSVNSAVEMSRMLGHMSFRCLIRNGDVLLKRSLFLKSYQDAKWHQEDIGAVLDGTSQDFIEVVFDGPTGLVIGVNPSFDAAL